MKGVAVLFGVIYRDKYHAGFNKTGERSEKKNRKAISDINVFENAW